MSPGQKRQAEDAWMDDGWDIEPQPVKSVFEGDNPYHTDGQKPPSAGGERRHRFELASPYGPDPDEDGIDRTFAPKVLHVIREGWEELRAADPDLFAGLTIEGSLVKGRAHDRSDADLSIFFNPGPDDDSGSRWNRLEIVDEGVENTIDAAITDAGLPGTFRSRGSATYHPMNPDIVDEHVARAVDRTARLEAGEDRSDIDEDIIAMFHMRIGSGELPKLRKRVLDVLSSSPVGETVFRKMMSTLGRREEVRREAEVYLPDTLEDGYDYFRLDP
jgi:hypothetical protein